MVFRDDTQAAQHRIRQLTEKLSKKKAEQKAFLAKLQTENQKTGTAVTRYLGTNNIVLHGVLPKPYTDALCGFTAGHCVAATGREGKVLYSGERFVWQTLDDETKRYDYGLRVELCPVAGAVTSSMENNLDTNIIVTAFPKDFVLQREWIKRGISGLFAAGSLFLSTPMMLLVNALLIAGCHMRGQRRPFVKRSEHLLQSIVFASLEFAEPTVPSDNGART